MHNNNNNSIIIIILFIMIILIVVVVVVVIMIAGRETRRAARAGFRGAGPQPAAVLRSGEVDADPGGALCWAMRVLDIML